MNYTHFVSVAGLVTNDKGNILLIKSPRRGWEYPGGMVEPGETFQDALLRELRKKRALMWKSLVLLVYARMLR